MIVGFTALFLRLVIPYSGDSERVVIAGFGGFYLVSLVGGVAEIRAGRAARHREWMLRAFAVGLSIATMRVIFIPAVMITDASPEQVAWLSVGSFAVHVLLAEYLIRRSRSSSVDRPNAVRSGRGRQEGSGTGR
jgi:Predicted membrane protein (DUF2306)